MRVLVLGFFVSLAAFIACTGADPDIGNVNDSDGGAPDGNGSSSGDSNAGSFALLAPSASVLVMPGETTKVAVEITRASGFAGAVKVLAQALPDGVTAEPIEIPAGATKADLVLAAAPTAAQAKRSAELVATSERTPSQTKALSITVRGKPGSRDTTFGTKDGSTAIADGIAHFAARAPDGSIVVLLQTNDGHALARYSVDGVRDAGFGASGLVALTKEPNAEFKTLHVASDGAIIAVARTDGQAQIHRIVNGAYETTFGTGGVAKIAVAGLLQHAAVDGKKRVVLGTDFADEYKLTRVTADGEVDTTFDAAPMSKQNWEGLVLRADDTPVLYGTEGSKSKLSVLTSSAGNTNTSAFDFAGGPAHTAAVVDSKTRTLVVGADLGPGRAFVLRYGVTGAADTTFAANVETFGAATDTSAYSGVFVEPTTNHVLCVGDLFSANAAKAAVMARYTESGVLDDTFGTNGRMEDPSAPGIITRSSVLLNDVPAVVAFRLATDGATSVAVRYWR